MDARKNSLSLKIGGTGLILQLLATVSMSLLVEIDPHVGPHIGLSMILLGVVLLIVGLGYYASAKGHHWAWGLAGLLSIIGLIVLAALPDRQRSRVSLKSMSLDVSMPVVEDGLVFHCLGCGYILNGITSSTCPECGRQFDGADAATMRVADALGRELLDKDVPPWTARWSLICGIVAMVMFCGPPLNLIAALCGIGFGHSARRAVRNKPDLRGSAGIALAGLIISYIALVLALAFTAFLIVSIMNE